MSGPRPAARSRTRARRPAGPHARDQNRMAMDSVTGGAAAAPCASHAEPPAATSRPVMAAPSTRAGFSRSCPGSCRNRLVRLCGRETELNALDAVLADGRAGPVTALICGPPGAGKTALAVWWLHRHRDHAPDGYLYARLGGPCGGWPRRRTRFWAAGCGPSACRPPGSRPAYRDRIPAVAGGVGRPAARRADR